MSTLKVNNLQVGQDSTATNNLTWFQPGSPDGTIRLGSGNAGSATTKFTFDKDGNLTCVGDITANSIIAPIEGTLDDWIVHAGDTNTKFGFFANDTFQVQAGGTIGLTVLDASVRVPTKLGINGAAPQTPLDVVADGSGYAINVRGRSSDNVGEIRFTSNNYGSLYSVLQTGATYLSFQVGSTTNALRIDSNGVICVNHTNALHSGKIQVSTSGSDAIDINAYSSTAANGGRLTFYRSKNATIGSNTTVADNDSLGRIDFRGYNTNGNAYNIGATIEAEVDGSVNSSTDMPSAIVLKTSTDGSSTPSERLRIDSTGRVLVSGGASPSSTSLSHSLQVTASSDADAIAVIGRAADDIGEISFYEADKSTNLGEIQYRTTETNIRARSAGADINFATTTSGGSMGDRLRIKSDGTVYTVTEGAKFGVSQDPTLTTMGSTSGTWDLPEVDGQTIGAEMRIGDINTNSTSIIRLASYGSGDSGTGGGAIMFTNTRNGSNSHHSDIAAIKGAREYLGRGYLRFFTADRAANTEKMRITSGGIVQIGGATANSADVDTSNTKLTIKQSANSQEDGIYIERSGERRGFYIYVGGALSQNDALGIVSNQLGGDTAVLSIDRGGDIVVGAGNIKMPNGKGIDFSNNTDHGETSTFTTLEDYEEGTWTPHFEIETRSASDSPVDGVQGRYVKVGNVVTVHYQLSLNGTPNERSTSRAWEIHGFPYTSKAGNTGGQMGGNQRVTGYETATYGPDGHFVFRLFNNTTYGRLEFIEHNYNGTRNASPMMLDNAQVIGTITYQSDG